MKALAPVVLFVYNRPEHSRKTVEALQKNSLAERSKLIIYSDGPKNESDSKKVQSVREYLSRIHGFKEIVIIEREKNLGLADSVISGVSEVINKYGNVIVLEDDIVTSQFFLDFMNNALAFYQNTPEVFSVSGYCHPIVIPDSYNYKIFYSHRASSWGWATWQDRWCKVDWENKNFHVILKDKKTRKLFNKSGEDLSPMLLSQIKGEIDSWAIRWNYTHFINQAFCVYPINSFVLNIGTDNSGTHSTRSKKYDVKLVNNFQEIKFSKSIFINSEIINQVNHLVRPSIIRRFINNFKLKFN